jgi:16S rRNA (adenine1518-N6/adenine1519-N6)-dimethyltransferase
VSRWESPGDLLREYSTRAKKRFGQHFLTDPNVLQRIVDLAGVTKGRRVLEIGPGCGTLTWQLLQNGAEVVAIEIDRDAVEFLRAAFDDRVDVRQADATNVDFAELLSSGGPWLVVANLPYNVATPILFRLLESSAPIERMALMFQKEVADRITADPGSKSYGALSLKIALYADARRELRLKGGAFTPPPRVESAVVVLEPIGGTRIEDPRLRHTFIQVVDAGFAMRRKTLRNALKRRWGTELVEAAIDAAGLDRRIRAEKLGFDEFLELATTLHVQESDDGGEEPE